MRRHAAKKMESRAFHLGSSKALREFMHVDDCADALVFLMQAYSQSQLINVGTGQEITIGDLARAIAQVVGYKGKRLVFDASKPDGMPRKLLDSSRILAMGWRPRIRLSGVYRKLIAGFSAGERPDRSVKAEPPALILHFGPHHGSFRRAAACESCAKQKPEASLIKQLVNQGNDAQGHKNQHDQQGDGVAANNAPELGNEDARKQCCDNEETDNTGFGQKPKRRQIERQRLAELP